LKIFLFFASVAAAIDVWCLSASEAFAYDVALSSVQSCCFCLKKKSILLKLLKSQNCDVAAA